MMKQQAAAWALAMIFVFTFSACVAPEEANAPQRAKPAQTVQTDKSAAETTPGAGTETTDAGQSNAGDAAGQGNKTQASKLTVTPTPAAKGDQNQTDDVINTLSKTMDDLGDAAGESDQPSEATLTAIDGAGQK